jgi:hypothetical protein
MHKTQIVAISLVIVLLLLGACAPAPTTTQTPALAPTAPTPAPTPTPIVPTEKQGIKDLATISITAVSQNWDADAEDDGIFLGIMYLDSKGQFIHFSNIPVLVTVELYSYRGVLDTFHHNKMELIYKTQVSVDHDMLWSEAYGSSIRIPFENIPIDHSKYYEFGTMKVMVTTPSQGDFEAIEDCVRLYPED